MKRIKKITLVSILLLVGFLFFTFFSKRDLLESNAVLSVANNHNEVVSLWDDFLYINYDNIDFFALKPEVDLNDFISSMKLSEGSMMELDYNKLIHFSGRIKIFGRDNDGNRYQVEAVSEDGVIKEINVL